MGDHCETVTLLSVEASLRGMSEIGKQMTMQAQKYFSNPFSTSEMYSQILAV